MVNAQEWADWQQWRMQNGYPGRMPPPGWWESYRNQQAQATASSLDANRPVMGSEYFKDEEQLTWREDANRLWEAEHGIDPETGDITGPAGPIPAGIGMKWQAIHDQAVWRSRYRMAQEALRMAQGATGLMTSYRAGGGAALQSGVYGQMANVQLQRAQMHTPLDLLGDYRRDQLARAGRSGRTESTVGTALQGLGAVLSLVPGLNVVGAGLMVGGGALTGYGNSRQAASIARAGGAQTAIGGQWAGGMNMAQNAQMLGQAARNDMAAGQAAQQAQTPGQPPAAATPTAGETAGTAVQQQPQAPQQLQQQGFQSPQGGQMQPPGGAQAAPGAAGGPMGMMGAPPVVGADGRFDPLAYAQYGVASSPAPQAMQLAMSEHLVANLQDDPSWAMMSMAVDRELMLRTGAA